MVDFVEPLAGNEAAFGFDLGSNPERLTAVQQAIDTGEAVATAPIRLVQESGEQNGFLLLLAVYQADELPDTVDERRETSIGVSMQCSASRLDGWCAGFESSNGLRALRRRSCNKRRLNRSWSAL